MKGKWFYLCAFIILWTMNLMAVDDVIIKTSGNTGTDGVSIQDSDSNTLFKVDSDGNAIHSGNYLNFGSTMGSSGYGVRDSSGTLKFKNSGEPSWSTLYRPAYGQIAFNHGSGTFNPSTGLYGTTQTTIPINADTEYHLCLPCSGTNGTWPFYSSFSDGVEVLVDGSSIPYALKIKTAGVYRISCTIALCGSTTEITAVEFEISRTTGGATSPFTDIESMSCVISTDKTKTDQSSGAINGLLTCAVDDVIQLGDRRLKGTATTLYIYCLNLNVERIK